MSNGENPRPPSNLPLARFLIKLATDDEARARFNQDQDARARTTAISDLTAGNELASEDKQAILDRNATSLYQLLRLNNQST